MTKTFTWERGPFGDCWECKSTGTFGILTVGGEGITRRCTKCRYTDMEILPRLDKRVIYLDQFAFSELHKLRSGNRRPDNWTPFWTEVSDLLKQAVLLQQAILPHSNIHHSETIVSHFATELRDTQEQIGGDIRFLDTDEVQLQQIEEFARAYFAGEEPSVTLAPDEVLEGDRNEWLPNIRISVAMDWSNFAPSTRKDRAGAHAGITSLVRGWRQAGWGFDEVLERELGAYLESRQGAILDSLKRFERGVAEEDPFALINLSQSFVQREIELVRHYASKAGVSEEDLTQATTEFWCWPKNRQQPFGRILAYMFAALAAQTKAGRKTVPTAGFMNDIRAIAAYAPYVDAMLIDKECAELLRYGRCRRELSHKARIFSLNNAGAFLQYLRLIVEGTSAEVRSRAKLAYGL